MKIKAKKILYVRIDEINYKWLVKMQKRLNYPTLSGFMNDFIIESKSREGDIIDKDFREMKPKNPRYCGSKREKMNDK